MYPIDFFWRAARRWPDRCAIDAAHGALSFAALARQVAALARALQSLDPEPQSRVGICARNHAEHIVALLAVLAAGKVWVPLNVRSTSPEIGRIVAATEPSILVVDRGGAGLVGAATAQQRVWCDGDDDDDDHSGDERADHAAVRTPTLRELVDANAGAPAPRLELPRDATQAIKFTGGTTGAPKGVMQPYRAWMANIVNQIHVWGFDERDRYVVAAPITHGTSTYLLPVLAQGGCLVLPREAGTAGVRDAFRDHGGTASFMPPTLVYMLMALPGTTRADFPQLRRLIYGGAPMPPDKIGQARDFFGPVLCTTYGQTEAPQILTALRPQDFDDPARRASVGRASWFSEIAIMAPDGRLLEAGEVGEVVARGELVMTGYWRLPDQTAATLKDGWLHTGDRGYLDPQGYLYLKDRLKDLVITGGFNVYPVDVENALGRHAAVHECAVFGVPDEKWGETVQAAVQLRPGLHASEDELRAFVREQLGPVQTPKRIHFHEQLPRSAVGKVLKTAVREQALGQTAKGQP